MPELHRVAVLGTGSIGRRHLSVLRALGVATIAVPVRESRLPELRAEGWNSTTCLEEAVARGATSAIIATDTGRHLMDACQALQLGLHLLVEKPLAADARGTEALLDLARERRLTLAVGCNLRFDPGLQAFRKCLREIGAVYNARIECRSYLPDWRPARDYHLSYSATAAAGGVLRDLIHEVDYGIWMFGAPQQVFGTLQNSGRLGIESEEAAEGLWVTEGGTRVSLGLDYLQRHPTRSVRASGEDGEAEYDLLARRLVLHRFGEAPRETVFSRTPDDTYEAEVTEFLRVVGGQPPCVLASGEDGAAALAVCDAWRRSHEAARMVGVVGVLG